MKLWGLGLWAASLSLLLAGWMAPHALPLRLNAVQAAGSWSATHSLRVDCDCSAAVFRHLVNRRAQPGWQETVAVNRAVPEWTNALEQAGFVVQVRHVRSGPHLALSSPSGQVWQGGYSRKRPRPGLPLEDLQTMQTFRDARVPLTAISAYGCAGNEAPSR
jgi:hypothetical protein